MMLRKLTLALALYGFAAGAAMASDTDWNGFYAGVSAGNADGQSDVSTSTIYDASGYFAQTSVDSINAAGVGKVDPSGFAGGVTFGFNWQKDNLLFGLEADWSSLSADDARAAGATYPCCAPTAYALAQETKVDSLATLRARLGYATGNSLFYVTAGWAQADIEINAAFTDTYDDALETFSGSKNKSDLVYGIGYEHGFNDNWSIKAEYLRADFGTLTGTSDNLTTDGGNDEWPENVFTHSTDLDLSVLRVGLNYRF
jgi:outer membrane immunogenic protein